MGALKFASISSNEDGKEKRKLFSQYVRRRGTQSVNVGFVFHHSAMTPKFEVNSRFKARYTRGDALLPSKRFFCVMEAMPPEQLLQRYSDSISEFEEINLTDLNCSRAYPTSIVSTRENNH